MTAHSISILSELKMSFGRCKEALSINCASINCTLLKAVPNVRQFLNVMNMFLQVFKEFKKNGGIDSFVIKEG